MQWRAAEVHDKSPAFSTQFSICFNDYSNIVFSLTAIHNRNKVNISSVKNSCIIQYSFKKWRTHGGVLTSALADGNSKNDTRQRNIGRQQE